MFDTSFRSNVFNPIWRHCLSDDCSPCSYSALPQHSPCALTGTVYPRYSRLTHLFTQVFALKATLEELFYTVSNIPPASLLFALYVHVCECVCLYKIPSRVLMEKGLLAASSCPQHIRDCLACVNNWETFVNKLICMSTQS